MNKRLFDEDYSSYEKETICDYIYHRCLAKGLLLETLISKKEMINLVNDLFMQNRTGLFSKSYEEYAELVTNWIYLLIDKEAVFDNFFYLKNFSVARVILNAFDKGIDVSPYLNICFSWDQVAQIEVGLRCNVDVSYYAKPIYSSSQMVEQRLALMKNVPFDKVADPKLTPFEMNVIWKSLGIENYKEIDAEGLLKKGFSAQQIQCMFYAIDSKVDYFKIMFKEFTEEEMYYHIKLLSSGRDLRALTLKGLSLNQVKEWEYQHITDSLLFKIKSFFYLKKKTASYSN